MDVSVFAVLVGIAWALQGVVVYAISDTKGYRVIERSAGVEVVLPLRIGLHAWTRVRASVRELAEGR